MEVVLSMPSLSSRLKRILKRHAAWYEVIAISDYEVQLQNPWNRRVVFSVAHGEKTVFQCDEHNLGRFKPICAELLDEVRSDLPDATGKIVTFQPD